MRREQVLGVHEFRADLTGLLRRFREDAAAAAVWVGAHRRPDAVLVPAGRYERLVARGGPPSDGEDDGNGPAIRALLGLSPEERLAGLVAARSLTASARRV